MHAGYSADLLPGFVATGVGIGFAFVPVSIAALAGVAHDDAGLASGLINTTQQIGGALGTAIVSSVAASHTSSLAATGSGALAALTRGYAWGFWVGFFFACAGVAAALTMIRRGDVPVGQPHPAHAVIE